MSKRYCIMGYHVTIEEIASLIYGKRIQIAKFIASGSTAATVEFTLLFVLTHYVGLHYLVSSSLGFAVAVCVGFTLQKFWTFASKSMDGIHRQAIQYLGLGLANLGINAVVMFLLVENFHLWYMLAQFFACGILACSNFLIYNLFIFKTEPGTETN